MMQQNGETEKGERKKEGKKENAAEEDELEGNGTKKFLAKKWLLP